MRTICLRLMAKATNGQPLSLEQRLEIDSLVYYSVLARTGSVKKAIEATEYVRRPDLVVNHLKKARLLPPDCFVEVTKLPDKTTGKCALFGVSFFDLSKRCKGIVHYVDDAAASDIKRGYGISPLDGDETQKLLMALIAHAHIAVPGLCETDPVMLRLCEFFGQEAVYKALKSGNIAAFSDLFLMLKEAA